MDQEQYRDLLKDSVGAFIFREERRGETIKPDEYYMWGFKNQVVDIPKFPILGKFATENIEPVHEIVGHRIMETGERELSLLEIHALVYDNAMCEEYMIANMNKCDYENSISCSNRLIGNCRLMKQDFDNFDPEVLDVKIEQAEKHIKRCQILSQCKNPETADLRLKLEECVANQRYEQAASIKKMIQKFESKK
jgi:hypothetical protein